jgi:TolB protein
VSVSRRHVVVCVLVTLAGAVVLVGREDAARPLVVDARVSPDGAWVAYAARARGKHDLDLFVIDVSRRQPPRRVAASAENDRLPTWSHDSRRLAYVVTTDDAEEGELAVVDRTGRRARTLVSMRVRDPEWAPDGRSLAFAVAETDAELAGLGGRLFVITADGRRLRRLAPGLRGDRPRWSPDGRSIAFWAAPRGSRPTDELRDRGDLYLTGVQDGHIRRLTRVGDVAQYTAAWSPDSSAILYARELELLSYAIETINPGTRRARRIMGIDVAGPPLTWSPDSASVAAEAVGPGVVVAHRDGSHRRLIDRQNIGSYPLWSPSGRFIAHDTSHGVFTPIAADVIVAGTRRRTTLNLTKTPERDEALAGWLADGRVALVRDDRELWTFDLRGRGRLLVVVD